MSVLKRVRRWTVLAALAFGACSESTAKTQPDVKDKDAGGGSDTGDDANDAGGRGPAQDAGQIAKDGGDPTKSDGGSDSGVAPNDSGVAPNDSGVAPSVRACLEAAQSKDTSTEALELVVKDGTRIAIVRYVDPDAFGTSGTTVWLPERFGYAHGAESACVTQQAKLSYQISHHNFDDLMGAEHSGLALTFHQTCVDYDKPMFWSAQAKRGSTTVWGPLDLSLVSCHNLTTQESCKARYQ